MQTYLQKTDQWLPRDWKGKVRDQWITKRHEEPWGWVKGMFTILIMVMISQMPTYVKIHQTVHFKYVWSKIHQLYLNKTIKIFYF